MAKETLVDKEVLQELKGYLLLKIDIDQYPELAKKI